MKTVSITRGLMAVLLLGLSLVNLVSRQATEFTFIFFLIALIIHLATTEKNPVKKLFPPLGFDWLFLAWFLILPVSHWINGNLNEHEISEIGEYRWMIGVYFLLAGFSITGISPRLVKIFLICISALCTYFLIDFLLHPQFPGFIGYPNRLTGMLFSATDFGHTMLFLFLFSVTFLFCFSPSKSPISYWVPILATFCTACNLFLSQTRSVLLAAALCLIGLALAKSKKLTFLLIGFSIAGSVSFYYFDLFGFKERVDYSISPQQTYDSARMMLWRGHIEMIKENFFFGTGYHHNQFHLRPYYDRLQFPVGAHEAHAHNQFLNIFAGVGILGILWYLLIMGIFLRLSVSNIRFWRPFGFQHALAVYSVVALAGFLIAGLTDTNFELMAPKYYLLLTWGIILYQNQFRKVPIPK